RTSSAREYGRSFTALLLRRSNGRRSRTPQDHADRGDDRCSSPHPLSIAGGNPRLPHKNSAPRSLCPSRNDLAITSNRSMVLGITLDEMRVSCPRGPPQGFLTA